MNRFLFGLLFAGLLGSGAAQAVETTDWDSYVAGELSPPTASMQAGQVRRHAHNLTAALLEARRHWDQLSPATRSLAARWLARPDTGGGDNLGGGAFIYLNPYQETRTPTTHFLIHWIDCSVHPTDGNCATAAYVAQVAGVLEDVYTYEQTSNATTLGNGTTGLGYAPVPSDGTRGNAPGDTSSNLYDVYLADVGKYGYYGYTVPEGSNKVSWSYLVIDNDFAKLQFGYDDPTFPLKVTVAHEYFHAVQMGYDQFENVAFMEHSSTWMETMAYPALHDNYQYIGEPYVDANGNGQYNLGESFTDRNANGWRDEGSLQYPHAPLDAFGTPYQLIQYGRFLWPQYLSEKFGPGIMKDIWQRCGASSGNNAFAAMDAALTADYGSSLVAAYQEYATWGVDKGLFADGANYPLAWVSDTQGAATALFSTVTTFHTGSQQHLSTVYVQMTGATGQPFRFNSKGTAALTMLVDDGSGTLTHEEVPLDASGNATWTATGTATRVIAVISNVSPTNDCLNWSLASGTTDAQVRTGCAGGGGSGGGGGLLDGLALAAGGLLLLRRRRG